MRKQVEERLAELNHEKFMTERLIGRKISIPTDYYMGRLHGKLAAYNKAIGFLEGILNPIDRVETKIEVNDVVELIDGPFEGRPARVVGKLGDSCQIVFEIEAPYVEDFRLHNFRMSSLRVVKDTFPTHCGSNSPNLNVL